MSLHEHEASFAADVDRQLEVTNAFLSGEKESQAATTVQEKSALLPCPFCGSDKANLLLPTCRPTTAYDAADRLYPVVRCSQCYVDVPGENEDYKGVSAITRWNTRHDAGRRGSSGTQPAATASQTPRTDAEASDGWSGDAECVSADFARQLEREIGNARQATERALLVEAKFSLQRLLKHAGIADQHDKDIEFEDRHAESVARSLIARIEGLAPSVEPQEPSAACRSEFLKTLSALVAEWRTNNKDFRLNPHVANTYGFCAEQLKQTLLDALAPSVERQPAEESEDATLEQLAAVAHVPDRRLRVELACCNAELEAAHQILDDYEGHKETTSLDMLMDRLKRYFPVERQPNFIARRAAEEWFLGPSRIFKTSEEAIDALAQIIERHFERQPKPEGERWTHQDSYVYVDSHGQCGRFISRAFDTQDAGTFVAAHNATLSGDTKRLEELARRIYMTGETFPQDEICVLIPQGIRIKSPESNDEVQRFREAIDAAMGKEAATDLEEKDAP